MVLFAQRMNYLADFIENEEIARISDLHDRNGLRCSGASEGDLISLCWTPFEFTMGDSSSSYNIAYSVKEGEMTRKIFDATIPVSGGTAKILVHANRQFQGYARIAGDEMILQEKFMAVKEMDDLCAEIRRLAVV